MNNIFIVVCGEYDYSHNEFVTDDIDKAVEFALSRYEYYGMPEDKRLNPFDILNIIEVWDSSFNKICEYGMSTQDKINNFVGLSTNELKVDLERAIRRGLKCA